METFMLKSSDPTGSLLKNFLRGMETSRIAFFEDEGLCLKNFLRGMETGCRRGVEEVGHVPQKLP